MFQKIVIVLVAISLASCSFFSNEKLFRFNHFSDIPDNEGIATWIPSFMPTDATQISIYRNLDLGTVFGSYRSATGFALKNDLIALDKKSIPENIQDKILRNINLSFSDALIFCSKREQEIIVSDMQKDHIFFYSDKLIENNYCDKPVSQ